MSMPKNVAIIDLMLGIPSEDPKPSYGFMRPLFRDRESLESFDFPVEYMFKDVPKTGRRDDYIQYTLEQMAYVTPIAVVVVGATIGLVVLWVKIVVDSLRRRRQLD